MVASFKAYFGINGQTGVTHFFVDSRSGFQTIAWSDSPKSRPPCVRLKNVTNQRLFYRLRLSNRHNFLVQICNWHSYSYSPSVLSPGSFFSGIRSEGFFRNIESVSDAVCLRVSVLHRKKQTVGHHRIGDLLFKTSTVSL